MATAVQDLPGDGASKAAVKIFAATALSSLVSRRRSSLRDGGNEVMTAVQDLHFLAILPCAHIYPLPVAFVPSTLLNKVGFP